MIIDILLVAIIGLGAIAVYCCFVYIPKQKRLKEEEKQLKKEDIYKLHCPVCSKKRYCKIEHTEHTKDTIAHCSKCHHSFTIFLEKQFYSYNPTADTITDNIAYFSVIAFYKEPEKTMAILSKLSQHRLEILLRILTIIFIRYCDARVHRQKAPNWSQDFFDSYYHYALKVEELMTELPWANQEKVIQRMYNDVKEVEESGFYVDIQDIYNKVCTRYK